MEFIDFLQPRIKQKLRQNIIITPQKCVIGIDYIHPWSLFVRMILGACFGPGPFALDIAVKTTIRESFWTWHFSRRGIGIQEKCPRNVSLDKINKWVFPYNPSSTKGFGTDTKHQGRVEMDHPRYLNNHTCYKPETLRGAGDIFHGLDNFKLI